MRLFRRFGMKVCLLTVAKAAEHNLDIIMGAGGVVHRRVAR